MSLNSNFLFVKRGCPFCHLALRSVTRINKRLPLTHQIRIMDAFKLENFGVKQHPIFNTLEKEGFNYYPFLYLSGVIVEPTSTEQLTWFLESYFKKEFIID